MGRGDTAFQLKIKIGGEAYQLLPWKGGSSKVAQGLGREICTCVTDTVYGRISDNLLRKSLDFAVDGLGAASFHLGSSAQPLQGLSIQIGR